MIWPKLRQGAAGALIDNNDSANIIIIFLFTLIIHQQEEGSKVLISLISDKYDSDTTNGMVMNCLSESVECSLLAIR